ncbi:MAG: U32 family peptidase [Prevotellaceae bacterium]|jgi:putative protease|nr:U32 family peptidase [Prevotellaceae bacterium]
MELLSPAKNIECGIEAINHGADAVYIGAPKFSARAAAANTIEDIASLVKYAHRYYAKVYVALNTILDDRELAEAEKIIRNLYEIGADALIIQDMGITQLNLPPIQLHASTQTDNRTVEKVKFLEQAGFDQIVLARELSLQQIREIATQTSVKLEAFVHGALCVCYSGQCYISQALCNRSANKGACAQLCRLPYSLLDASGNIIAADKHLLSLKDLNLSGHLQELIDAGISSFKIEGRLKDVSYVKNITAFYRQKLDQILEDSGKYKKNASGKCRFFFLPNPEKSFSRGATDYFIQGRNNKITSFDSPKSLGEYIGIVASCSSRCVSVESDIEMANGDGFCYVNQQGSLLGFKANRVEGNNIFPSETISLPKGAKLYRNYDQVFEKLLSRKSAERKIQAHIRFAETDEGFCYTITDEDNVTVTIRKKQPKEIAQNDEKAMEAIRKQFSKTGNTIFEISGVTIMTNNAYFIQPSLLAEWRRELIELLELKREGKRLHTETKLSETTHPYPSQTLDYKGNVHNQKAKEFYIKHLVKEIANSFEQEKRNAATLMVCKHCLKYSFGLCPKNKTNNQNYLEPFFLLHNNKEKLRLHFDCKRCEMQVSR